MGMVKTFCVCCNVRSGSLFCGIYSLLSSALYIGMILMRFVGCKLVHVSQVHAAVTYLTFILFGLLAFFAVLLVVGIHLDRRELVLPWIVQGIICMLFGTATVCWMYIYTLRSGKDVHIWESVILTYHIFNLIVTVYCIFCVFSQYQELTLGRGTWRHYRRRQRCRSQRQALAIFVTDMGVEATPIDSGHFNISLEQDSGSSRRSLNPFIPPPPYELPPYMDKPPPYSTLAREGDVSYLDSTKDLVNTTRLSLVARNRNCPLTANIRPTLAELARQATLGRHTYNTTSRTTDSETCRATRRHSTHGTATQQQAGAEAASGRSSDRPSRARATRPASVGGGILVPTAVVDMDPRGRTQRSSGSSGEGQPDTCSSHQIRIVGPPLTPPSRTEDVPSPPEPCYPYSEELAEDHIRVISESTQCTTTNSTDAAATADGD